MLDTQATGLDWHLSNVDCIDGMRDIPDASVGLTVSSLPYLSLFVYSAQIRDLGNCASDTEFWEHFRFVIAGLLRITKPGRIVAIDCMNIPSSKANDGFIGLKDFRGDIIREFVAQGFIYHSEHCIWKDPLLAAVRTKALGLLHKTIVKDSSMSRAGIPQYLIAFRKPGTNQEPIAHPDGLEWFGEDPPTTGNLAHERWRRYASPVWMDIDSTDTLNVQQARESEDEKHVCPMALGIIERAVQLWSNPGDVVFDPFTGIGSTGVVALRRKRKFLGSELKSSYFRTAVRNLQSVGKQTTMFEEVAK